MAPTTDLHLADPHIRLLRETTASHSVQKRTLCSKKLSNSLQSVGLLVQEEGMIEADAEAT